MALDIQLFYLLNTLAGQSPFLDKTIIFFASYLAYIVILVFAALVFFSQYAKREKWELLLVAGLSGVIARFGVAEIIRAFIHRPRPFSVLQVHKLIDDTAWSFPSGHAVFFFAMATAVYLYNTKWGTGLFIVAALITLSRVAAGVHYPSDIAGGAVIGAIIGYLTVLLVRRVVKKARENNISTY